MNYSGTILPSITAILLAAGIGSRMRANCPKQYLTIGHKSILEYSIEVLLLHPCIQRVIVVINLRDHKFKRLLIAADPRISVAIGGRHRADSVLAGLQYAENAQWVLVHDAARPCLHHDDITRLLTITKYSKIGGILVVPVRDTIKRAKPNLGIISHTIERQNLWHALTPQLFPLALFKHCLQWAIDANVTITDDASALEYCGYHPVLVSGRSDNIKVTWPEDLSLAAFYLTQLHNQGV
ncbi:2-C-methyl-D-erythritol 4-phosphate cytidylyltransferase [Serratia symbiotica str. 'Cinara cedri']|nr:2-C-methyl-D-erythritol 4-phosphate cytidylyltransferase [Serratia symbiotica str. 'Cinara cedri']